MSVNRVIISGNLTREPELRATASGTSVLEFGVAVNDRRKNQQTGEWEDYPNYVDCVMFGNRAQSLGQYLHKGGKVALEGKLRWSQWQDKDTGKNRSKLDVIVDEIDLMQRPKDDQSYSQAPQPAYNGQQQAQPYQQPQQGYTQPQNASQAPMYQQPANQQQPNVYAQPVASIYDEEIPF